MKHTVYIIFFLMAFLITSCNQKEPETVQENHGEKKVEYYENGNVKSVSFRKNGKVHGKVVHYYPNNQIEVEANYLNGKEEGESITYYPSGAIHKKVTYKGGRLVGEANFYTEEGNLYERDIYDEEGNLIYVLKLNADGSKKQEMIVPIVQPKKDTITLDEDFEGKVNFAYSIPGEIAVFTGRPDSTRQHLQDTIFMKRLDNSTFSFSIAPYKKGYNVLPVVVVYNPASPQDTLALDGVAITYPYFVK